MTTLFTAFRGVLGQGSCPQVRGIGKGSFECQRGVLESRVSWHTLQQYIVFIVHLLAHEVDHSMIH